MSYAAGRPPGRKQRPDGWHNTCTRMMPDRAICGVWYWYAWVPSTGKGKRVAVGPDWEPTTEPHVCRNGTGGK